ncbi:transposase [Streptomyces sp. NPDC004609]|uniref:IS110 family transposase n=1 Tax=Streptomyces sp. NPDC004609 TaxID=3364704 RepID=UPI0036861606
MAEQVVGTYVRRCTVEGRPVQQVWTVASTTNAILELGDRLVCQGVQRVLMEATASYWRPFFFLLEARGLECWLVNARDVKNVPGRPKTDKLDAVWLAKLAERGMVRASFVPPKQVRQLRDFTRTRTVFVQERTRHKHRVEKALENAQIKLSTVVSDLFGMSGRAMPDALVAGEGPRPPAPSPRPPGHPRPHYRSLIVSTTSQCDRPAPPNGATACLRER